MAERVESMPPPGAGPPGRYPWGEWFDGTVWELIQGKDFEVSVLSFKPQAFQAARRRGIHALVRVRGDRVYIQAQR